MGILSRLLRLCKADVHGVMDQMEDKELLLKQYLREMEENLSQKKDQLARTDRIIRQVTGDLDLHREELRRLEADLDLSLGKGKDDIARMLIRKRRTIEGGADMIAQRLDRVTAEKRFLQETLDRQLLQYEELKVKVAGLCRRPEGNPFSSLRSPEDHLPAWKNPTDEEIELELLQRKASLQQGGAP
jgi:phage shock protein A